MPEQAAIYQGREFPVVNVAKDVVVVGGGTAGICAAVSAARSGAKTALVTDRPVLGGNASSEIRVTPSGADTAPWNRYARESGIMEEITLRVMEKAGRSGIWRWLHFDDVAFDLCYAEPNLELFLNATIHKANMEGPAKIASVEGIQLRSERTLRFEAKEFIDCSGDGALGFLANAEYRVGREAKSEFNEAHAPETPDLKTMGATLMFSSVDRGHPVPYKAPAWAIDARELQAISNPDCHRSCYRLSNGGFYGLWWAEYGGSIDSIHDDGQVVARTRALVYGIWDYIKNSGRYPDVANQELDWVGYLPGKRESRRLIGDYICNANDFLSQRRFDDAIGFAGWPIDIHPPKGYMDSLPPCTHDYLPGITDIPFRAIYSKSIDNLLFAGRNISVSHEGLGTLRVIATTAVMGEAAGSAAAICAKDSITPRDIYKTRMESFRKGLARNDVSINGYKLMEKEDLSRTSKATASSSAKFELPEGSEWHNLAEPLCVVLPVETETLETVSFQLKPIQPGSVEIEVFSCDRPENYRLQNKLGTYKIACDKEGWHQVGIDAKPGDGRKIFIAFKAAKNIMLRCATGRLSGVLAFKLRPEQELGFKSELAAFGLIPCFKASPEQNLYSAGNINNGFIRPLGVPNLWSSARMRPGHPEWIELRFEKESEISQIELVFNTNMNLNRFHSHGVFAETVRDYEIEVLTERGYEPLLAEEENALRFRRHKFEPRRAKGVRLLVSRTWGHLSAEVFDMRVYK